MNRSPTDIGMVDVSPAHGPTDAEIAEQYDDSVECWDCGGEGAHDEICECEDFEDTCCCLHPTPKRCRTCGGTGYIENEP